MPISPAAQQLLCACITADMRSPNTCCASGNQLVGGYFSTCTIEITQYALKGQKLLAQGIALGYFGRKPVAL